MEKLLNCPCCGGEAILLEPRHHMDCFINKPTVICKKCGLSIEDTSHLLVIKKWNTRKPLEKILDRLNQKSKEPGYQHPDEDYFVGMEEALSIVQEEI